nr:hypothetical protein [uncultured bacterium]
MPTEGRVMPRLKLTDTERLILANQYEILAALKNDDSYGRIAEELRDGKNGSISSASITFRPICKKKMQSLW